MEVARSVLPCLGFTWRLKPQHRAGSLCDFWEAGTVPHFEAIWFCKPQLMLRQQRIPSCRCSLIQYFICGRTRVKTVWLRFCPSSPLPTHTHGFLRSLGEVARRLQGGSRVNYGPLCNQQYPEGPTLSSTRSGVLSVLLITEFPAPRRGPGT